MTKFHSTLNTTLALALIALSNTAVADLDKSNAGTEGVIIDLSQLNLPANRKGAATEVVASAKTPEGVVLTNDAETIKVAKAAETSEAAKARRKEIFDNLIAAVKPEDDIPPLSNKRYSAYVSEKVVYAERAAKTERFDLEDARSHLGLLISEERDTILQGGLAFDTPFLEKALRLSFGARGYGALLSEENTDIFAAAVGAETAYRLPFKKLPLELGASFYYAPDILTFGAGERTIDTQIDVTLPVRNQLSVFGGIRYLSIDTRPGDSEVDNRAHVGLRWDFE